MAAPITYIVLAQKVYKNYFSDKDEEEFFIGTSFPDIRYLGVIARDATHFDVTVINQFTNESSF